MVWQSRVRVLMLALVALATAGASVEGQSASPTEASRDLESRAQLEAEARSAEAQNRTGEAWLLRSRLQRGDFQEGDRIVVTLLGSTTFNDTISVRAGKLLPLPRMGDVPLEGVLRSELGGRISSHLARFLRDSSVRATPLVRIAVLGQVARPGFYYTSADALLSDMLMKAGGPSANADLGKMSIRRGGELIWSERDTRTAMSDGLSIERLHLRAGDEVYVGEQKRTNWTAIAQIGISLLGVAFALTRL
jgi:protein involved in polysaccharide export with SLBB domain